MHFLCGRDLQSTISSLLGTQTLKINIGKRLRPETIQPAGKSYKENFEF